MKWLADAFNVIPLPLVGMFCLLVVIYWQEKAREKEADKAWSTIGDMQDTFKDVRTSVDHFSGVLDGIMKVIQKP